MPVLTGVGEEAGAEAEALSAAEEEAVIEVRKEVEGEVNAVAHVHAANQSLAQDPALLKPSPAPVESPLHGQDPGAVPTHELPLQQSLFKDTAVFCNHNTTSNLKHVLYCANESQERA